ncbi:type II toxin-antitoxin system RelE/ParE family toxin [Geminocystis sp. GBBB08]|uniref:type II toxin-antitoxin system RelE family toxin n=1 Tax=Geminocystis sp. GBBB08 TaxID=2604140 RepID=UPI0027E2320E|nr:type II toxin-antitoxin system RelE/ParE family toxin [Geminocystis sp. GBBB08]MBL1210005.1 type II toxin-antitoxin system RelE/ParE family toxin [Geminocystis sp. GBBB08]
MNIDSRIKKELKKLDKVAQKRIIAYLREEIAIQENPLLFGKGLQGNKQGLWRYRVGDYRVICRILDDELIILVVKVGHRKNVYLD